MTDYASMSIDNLTDYRNLWPAQQSEWTRAELALQKRRAVRDAFLDLAEELRDEGLVLIPEPDLYDAFLSGMEASTRIHGALAAVRAEAAQ